MNIYDQEYFDRVKKVAKTHGLWDQLEKSLQRLQNLADNYKGVLWIYKDFAPLSFYWEVHRVGEGGSVHRCMNGGLIFHGAHDRYGSGCAPTFSSCLEPTDGWSIHT